MDDALDIMTVAGENKATAWVSPIGLARYSEWRVEGHKLSVTSPISVSGLGVGVPARHTADEA